jgi:Ca-activated chloride channel family protein
MVNLQFGGVGYGSVFLLKGKDMEFVCNLNENVMQQAIILQPGTYKVVFRFRTTKETILSKDRTFTVKPGESVIVNLRN